MVDETSRLWSDSMPAAYEQGLVPTVFRPFAQDLAERAAGREPRRILELAAGTGVLTRELVTTAPRATIVATDFNAAMVAFGRERVPEADWRQADALSLPFDDGAFDIVVCQFGVMFFPDKRAGFRESRRVLAAGGALLFNTWAAIEDHTFQLALVRALETVFPDDPPTFMVSVPHGYAAPDLVVADVRPGGFEQVAIETVTVQGHAPSVAELAAGCCGGTPLRAELEARGELGEATARVAREMEIELGGAGPVVGTMAAHVVIATMGEAPL